MIHITLEWGRLASFPVEKDAVNINTEGGMFSRAFKGHFNADEKIIHEWVSRSPGLQNAKKEYLSDQRIKYAISPGGGAGYAEVIIDYRSGLVEFEVRWS